MSPSHEKTSFSHIDTDTGSLHTSSNGAGLGVNTSTHPAISLTPSQYERLFFQPGGPSPPGAHTVDLSRQFGNPSALGMLSFILCLSPTACFLLGFDGTTGTSGVALVGTYYFVGGLGLFAAGLLEWVLGNTFPFLVFTTFGGFWFHYGVLNDPAHAITSAFTDGQAAVDYTAGLVFSFIFWIVLVSVYWLAAWRTNVVFVGIFSTLWMTMVFLAVAYDKLTNGDVDSANLYLKISGGFGLAASAFGWYSAFALVMASVVMPFSLPVGDLSTRVFVGRKMGAGDLEDGDRLR